MRLSSGNTINAKAFTGLAALLACKLAGRQALRMLVGSLGLIHARDRAGGQQWCHPRAEAFPKGHPHVEQGAGGSVDRGWREIEGSGRRASGHSCSRVGALVVSRLPSANTTSN